MFARTKITMADNSLKNIADVRVDELVQSWDERTSKLVVRPVLRCSQRKISQLWVVRTSHDTLYCSLERLFLVAVRGWIAADALHRSDELVQFGITPLVRIRHNGNLVERAIAASNSVRSHLVSNGTPSWDIAYDLLVAETHTYLANHCVVHNGTLMRHGRNLRRVRE